MREVVMIENPVVYEKLTSVFRDVLDEDDLVLTPGMTADDVDGWDSLSHVRLVLAVWCKVLRCGSRAAQECRRVRRDDPVENMRAVASLPAHRR
jgi:hypothetical protein